MARIHNLWKRQTPMFRSGVMTLMAISSIFATPEVFAKTQTMWVASYTQRCVGMIEMDCMQVKYHAQGAWENFYQSINGFKRENGYEYILNVDIQKIESPPADGSSLKYRLKQIISKKKIPSKPQSQPK